MRACVCGGSTQGARTHLLVGRCRRQVGDHLRPRLRGRIIKSVGFGPSRTLGEQEPSAECAQPNFGKSPLADFASKSRGLRHHLQRRVRSAVTTCHTPLCSEQNYLACRSDASAQRGARTHGTAMPRIETAKTGLDNANCPNSRSWMAGTGGSPPSQWCSPFNLDTSW